MALRRFSQQWSLLKEVSHFASPVRHASSAPTVFDKIVQFFVIDKDGHRHTVRGLAGQTIAEAIKENGGFPADSFMPHVWEPGAPDCHVIVAYEYLDKLPALSEEQQQKQQRLIEDFARQKARDNSRFGHFIPLSPELNGVTVAVGYLEPWQNP